MAQKTESDQTQDFAAKLAAKILLVMDDVKSIVKDGKNSFHGYKFASDAAIITEVRVAMIKHKLVALPDQVSCERSLGVKGKKGEAELDFTTVRVAYTLIDAETGYATTVHVHGQGQDSGDKGVYKAATGAEKYFFLKAFMIPTEDDPEASEGVAVRQVQPERSRPAPVQAPKPAPAQYSAPAKVPAAAVAAITDSDEVQSKAQELIDAIKEQTSFVSLEKFAAQIKPTIETFSPALQAKVREAYFAEKKKFQKLEK